MEYAIKIKRINQKNFTLIAICLLFFQPHNFMCLCICMYDAIMTISNRAKKNISLSTLHFFFMPFYFNFVSWVGHKKKKYFQNKISLILLKLIFVLETIFILEEFNVNPLNLRKSLCRYVNTLHASNCFCCYVWAKGELRRIERVLIFPH